MTATRLLSRVGICAALALLGTGCAMTKQVRMLPTAGGAPGVATFKSGIGATSGEIEARMPDGSVLTGRWTEVQSALTLQSMYVTTPQGTITAQSLAPSGGAWGVATLNGQGVTMLCVYTGTYSSGFARCMDSLGYEWIGNW